MFWCDLFLGRDIAWRCSKFQGQCQVSSENLLLAPATECSSWEELVFPRNLFSQELVFPKIKWIEIFVRGGLQSLHLTINDLELALFVERNQRANNSKQ